jgi:hypothetical protein
MQCRFLCNYVPAILPLQEKSLRRYGTHIMTLTKDVMLLFFFLVPAVHNQSVTADSYCYDLVVLPELDRDIFFTMNVMIIPSWVCSCGISDISPQV